MNNIKDCEGENCDNWECKDCCEHRDIFGDICIYCGIEIESNSKETLTYYPIGSNGETVH